MTLISTISIDLAWTGSGALWRNTSVGTSHCGSYNATNQGMFDFQFATAIGSVGDLNGVWRGLQDRGRAVAVAAFVIAVPVVRGRRTGIAREAEGAAA